MRFGVVSVFFATVALALGCLPPYGILPVRPCTMQYVYGVSVNVTDARTGQPINNAVVTITDGGYSETLQSYSYDSDGTYVGAGERPGTYVMTVTAPGYPSPFPQTFTLGFDGCHVIPQSFNVALQPI